MCEGLIKEHVDINRTKDLIVEPSAGNGAFIGMIKKLCKNHIFFDIKPEHKEVLKMNYLKFPSEVVIESKFRKVHVIGNPPFGRCSSLAIKFIRKSCEYCDTLSFILPRSFKKESMKKKFPSNFHLVCEKNIPDNAFEVDGNTHTVACVFQIWEKRDRRRRSRKASQPAGFKFCKASEHPDIAVRSVGNLGTIYTGRKIKDMINVIFVKFTNGKSLDNNIKKVSKAKFKQNNNTVMSSLSKPELTREYNKLLGG